MEKFIPFEKLSKKKQKELNAIKRKDWNGINPVTRKSENPKAYNRRKAQKRSEFDSVPFLFYSDILTETPFTSTPSSAGIMRYFLPLIVFVSTR